MGGTDDFYTRARIARNNVAVKPCVWDIFDPNTCGVVSVIDHPIRVGSDAIAGSHDSSGEICSKQSSRVISRNNIATDLGNRTINNPHSVLSVG